MAALAFCYLDNLQNTLIAKRAFQHFIKRP